jgi:hypothetical protein
MTEEVKHNHVTGKTLYFCRFIQSNSNVMLANPATNEVWGTGGRDADDYDVQMSEEGGSGHYTGDFASGGAIAAGTYTIAVYNQAGASPADSDVVIAQGEIYWDGTAEINLYTMDADLVTIIANTGKVINVYPTGEGRELTGGAIVGFVPDEK